MTKYRVYLRVGRGTRSYKIECSKKPNYNSLKTHSNGPAIPTLQLCFDLDIDNDAFEAVKILLDKKVEHAKPAINIEESDNGEQS